MSRYQTIDGLQYYDFTEAYVAQMQRMPGYFFAVLDNVTILPENPHNRDIRQMRANEFTLRIREGRITSLAREGYKVYDADGRLMEQFEDEPVAEAEYDEILQSLGGACVCELKKEADRWKMIAQGEEECYVIVLTGTEDVQEWDRFLNKE